MSGTQGTTTAFTDYMGIEGMLSDEARLVRKTAREFVNREVLPVIERHAQAQTFPAGLIPTMGELGFFGATLPERYGCAGLSHSSYGWLLYELERGDSGLRSFASVQGALVMWPIFTYGSEAQKDHWLPLLASGAKIGCFGLTEPDFGSNPGGMLTRAEPAGNGKWRLNGSKMWITNGTVADLAVVWARTPDGIRGFLVEKGTKGFSAPEMHGKWSLRASVTSELVLEDVEVDGEASLLPGATGLKAALACLTQARYGIAWGALGAADACYQCALDYAPEPGPVRPSDRLVPAAAGEAGLDGHRAHQGPAAGPAAGGPQGAGAAQPRPGVHGQDEQRQRGPGDRPPSPNDPGRQRHPGRVPGHAPHVQPGERLHLRGRPRPAGADGGPAGDWHPRATADRPRRPPRRPGRASGPPP